MSKIFFGLLLSLTFFAADTQSRTMVSPIALKATTVYICNNGKTEVYHVSKDCSSVKRCTHEIKEVSETDAINKYQLRKCKTCGR
jgi:hypothetical protein